MDANIALTYFIHMEQVKNLSTSTLVFNITQFFPSLNYYLLILILRKAGFDSHVVNFFSSYLINRKTQYFQNNFTSSVFNIKVGVDQDSALSSILLALYLVSFLHILENCLKNLNLHISILSFVNDGLLIAQSKSLHISNSLLFCSYNVTSNLLSQFGLLAKHSKMEVFHFTRSQGSFNPLSLYISFIRGLILYPKDFQRYLGFIFNRKLLFHKHINFYSNKAISTVKCMKILDNSTRELNLHQKHLLYRSYTMLITLSGFQLWYYHKALLSYPLKILEAFKTSPSLGVKAITSLIPINLHLQKLSGRSQLHLHSLLLNHILCSLLEARPNLLSIQHALSLNSLTRCQYEYIRGYLVNMDN